MKRIIITAGPTNEFIDAVMKITNMSTGALGCKVAQTILDDPKVSANVERIYYISPKLAYKPKYAGNDGKLECLTIESADDLLRTMTELLKREHIDAVVHSCAVGDYKGRYAARAEDLAAEIAKTVMNMPYGTAKFNAGTVRDAVMHVLEHPLCVQNNETKMSSYEPNLMVMMDLTPKVIGCVKDLSPSTMLIGFKLLENVPKAELFDVASRLRQKNQADAIIANDLARIGNGKHPAMIVVHDGIVGRDAILKECETKAEIAEAIKDMIFGPTEYVPVGKDAYVPTNIYAVNVGLPDGTSRTYHVAFEGDHALTVDESEAFAAIARETRGAGKTEDPDAVIHGIIRAFREKTGTKGYVYEIAPKPKNTFRC